MVIWHCSSRRGLSKELQWSVAVLQLFNNSLLINPLWKFFFFNKVDLEPSFAKNIQLRKNQTSDHRIWLKRNLTVNPVQGLASHLCDCILGGSETVCIDMSKHFATQKYNIVYIYINDYICFVVFCHYFTYDILNWFVFVAKLIYDFDTPLRNYTLNGQLCYHYISVSFAWILPLH
jgi:hypothetical protein